jgi:hypothetical protein
MSITIGGISLDNDMAWLEEFDQAESAGVADRTIVGTMVIQSFPIYGGRVFTLQGDANHGWQKRTTVQSLHDLARNNPTGIHVVSFRSVNYNMVFRHEDQPVVSFVPITYATAPDGNFWYYGSIKLRMV